MHIHHLVVINLGALASEIIFQMTDSAFIAGNRWRRKDDSIARLNFQGAMFLIYNAHQNSLFFRLRASANNQNLARSRLFVSSEEIIVPLALQYFHSWAISTAVRILNPSIALYADVYGQCQHLLNAANVEPWWKRWCARLCRWKSYPTNPSQLVL